MITATNPVPLIKTTGIFQRNIKSKKRVVINQGGTGSSKTYSILQVLIMYGLYNPAPLIISIVSETLPHLRKGAMKDFFDILIMAGIYDAKRHNKSELYYIFPSGTKVEFFSVDSPLRVLGPRRDILFINECINVSWDTYMQLEIRTNLRIFLDFNPTRRFWVHEELIGNDNAELILSTFLDNPYLPKNIVDSLLAKKDRYPAWWKVFGEGQTGELEGLIFNDWSQVDDDKFPIVPNNTFGMDFGFVNDPTVLMECAINGGELWLRERFYKVNLKTPGIHAELSATDLELGVDRIWGDPSEPRLMSELRDYGWKIFKCNQTKITDRLDLLTRYHINVTKSSVNCIKELKNYMWDRDPITGKYINEPVDAFNHCIDAAGYGAWMKWGRRSMGMSQDN